MSNHSNDPTIALCISIVVKHHNTRPDQDRNQLEKIGRAAKVIVIIIANAVWCTALKVDTTTISGHHP